MYTLRVITWPWNGGDFRLDPLPSNDRNSTTFGDYHRSQLVTIRALPAPGWEVVQVDQARRVGDSNDFEVVMEKNLNLAMSFRELPTASARAAVTPQPSAGEDGKDNSLEDIEDSVPPGTGLADGNDIAWGEFYFSGEPWEKVLDPEDCADHGCLSAQQLPFMGDATIGLVLYEPSNQKYQPWMGGEAISFEVKRSTSSSCCETLVLTADSPDRFDDELGQWSGAQDWNTLIFPLPENRPVVLEWKYINNGIIEHNNGNVITNDVGGDGQLWLRNVQIR